MQPLNDRVEPANPARLPDTLRPVQVQHLGCRHTDRLAANVVWAQRVLGVEPVSQHLSVDVGLNTSGNANPGLRPNNQRVAFACQLVSFDELDGQRHLSLDALVTQRHVTKPNQHFAGLDYLALNQRLNLMEAEAAGVVAVLHPPLPDLLPLFVELFAVLADRSLDCRHRLDAAPDHAADDRVDHAPSVGIVTHQHASTCPKCISPERATDLGISRQVLRSLVAVEPGSLGALIVTQEPSGLLTTHTSGRRERSNDRIDHACNHVRTLPNLARRAAPFS